EKREGEPHMRFGLSRRLPAALAISLMLGLITTVTALAADPNGAETLATSEDPAATAITFVWLMVCGTLVFFMQAGFAFLEAGFTRARNIVNVLTKNFMDFCIGGLAYFFFGFAIMY